MGRASTASRVAPGGASAGGVKSRLSSDFGLESFAEDSVATPTEWAVPSSISSPVPSSISPRRKRHFSIQRSTEENYRDDDAGPDEQFYGPFAHIRPELDYSWHARYSRKRMVLQDAIIESYLDGVTLTDLNGDVGTTPTNPWIVFTAGAMGAGKGHTVNEIVRRGHFPIMGFVSVDPDDIRRCLPEFSMYVESCPEKAGDMTQKEAGHIAEILALAGLQAGKNVLVDGSLRDSDWYKKYFAMLREEYPSLQLAILHVVAPREAVFERAAARAERTGRVVPRETLEMALEQVPRSVGILSPLADYFCELNNAPNQDIEILTPGEDWDTFRVNWLQKVVYVEGNRAKPWGARHRKRAGRRGVGFATSTVHRSATAMSFSIFQDTSENHGTEDMEFYGRYAHIREIMDYSYYTNYKKERQWIQDAIIERVLKMYDGSSSRRNSNEGDAGEAQAQAQGHEQGLRLRGPCMWLVHVAGVKDAGRRHTIRNLVEQGRFPLDQHVMVDPEELRMSLPESQLYEDSYSCPVEAEDMTKKEVRFMKEIIIRAALRAGKHCVVQGTLKNWEWHRDNIQKLKEGIVGHTVRVAILHVVAPPEQVFWRAEKRSSETSCSTAARSVVEDDMEKVPLAVKALRPHVDYFCELRNADGMDVEILTEGEDWDSLKKHLTTRPS